MHVHTYVPIFTRRFKQVHKISDAEESSIRRKGLIGTIQSRVHADLKNSKGRTFTLGSINFDSVYFSRITKDNAPEIEAILKQARADIMKVLARGTI